MQALTVDELGLLSDVLRAFARMVKVKGMSECSDAECGYYDTYRAHSRAIDVLAPRVREVYLDAIRSET